MIDGGHTYIFTKYKFIMKDKRRDTHKDLQNTDL